jgi:perosamine synthetase
VTIPLSRPDIGQREIELVTDVLRSSHLSLGPRLIDFERKFAAYVGTRHAIAVNSGTSALHLCVRALGVGEGDEVLTTSFSFVASANCVLYERATPVFVDIEPTTLNIDPMQIRTTIARDYIWCGKRLTNRRSGRVLKAILPVHVFGLPCDMVPILQIADAFNLRVIEDACEALAATYHGQNVGTFGDVGVFAFYPNKQMTTAEGGMIVTNDARIASLCRSLRNQGRDDAAGWLRHVQLGYNYRLSELHSALGIAQMERVGALLAARERVATQYTRWLADARELALPCVCPGRKRSWFVYVIRLLGPASQRVRQRLIDGLRQQGIASQAYFPAIHHQPYLRDLGFAGTTPLPHTESASDSCLALPFFSSMTANQVEKVCGAVREILTESGKSHRARVGRHLSPAAATPKSEQTVALR